MLIELCGADGVGKSSVTAGLINKVRTTGAQVYERVVRSEGRVVMKGVSGATFNSREIALVVGLDYVREANGRLWPFYSSTYQHVFVHHYCTSYLALLVEEELGEDRDLLSLTDLFPKPDLSLRLNLDFDETMERLKQRPRRDFLLTLPDPEQAVRKRVAAFQGVAQLLPYSQTVVGAAGPVEEVINAAWGHLQALLLAR